jgi:predicted transcriptional regulator
MNIKIESSGLNRNDKIINIANLNPTKAYDNETIKEVVRKTILSQHRRIPIVNKKDELIGILTTMDILDAFLRQQNFNEDITSIMIREVIFCFDNDSIESCIKKMKISRRGGLPIINKKGILVGIVNERDVVRKFVNVNFNYKVEDVMTKKPLVISNKISIYDCLKSLVNSHYRRLPVVEKGKLIGIVTSSDMIRFIEDHNYRLEDLHAPVDYIMRKDVITISKDRDISDAIKLMVEKDVGGILVVDNSNLIGIITERDILEIID